jgi:cation:H+ antiporter
MCDTPRSSDRSGGWATYDLIVLFGLVLVTLAAGLLWLGAELFVEHAAMAGQRLEVTGLAVGLLLAGAEPEELITAVIAAVQGRGGIAAGDAIGANVTMLTLVLGLAALMRPLPIRGQVRRYLLGASVLGGAAAVMLSGGIDRTEGLILVLLYAAAVVLVWIWERQPPAIGELGELEEKSRPPENGTAWTGLLFVAGGVLIMALGGWVAVLGADRLVDAFGVAESVVGLSVVALATTAEMFALAVSAHRREVSELAVAGVVGSAGYNATVTLGGAAMARPIVTSGVIGAAWLAAALPLLVLGLGAKTGQLTRWSAALLIAVYVVYLTVLYT